MPPTALFPLPPLQCLSLSTPTGGGHKVGSATGHHSEALTAQQADGHMQKQQRTSTGAPSLDSMPGELKEMIAQLFVGAPDCPLASVSREFDRITEDLSGNREFMGPCLEAFRALYGAACRRDSEFGGTSSVNAFRAVIVRLVRLLNRSVPDEEVSLAYDYVGRLPAAELADAIRCVVDWRRGLEVDGDPDFVVWLLFREASQAKEIMDSHLELLDMSKIGLQFDYDDLTDPRSLREADAENRTPQARYIQKVADETEVLTSLIKSPEIRELRALEVRDLPSTRIEVDRDDGLVLVQKEFLIALPEL